MGQLSTKISDIQILTTQRQDVEIDFPVVGMMGNGNIYFTNVVNGKYCIWKLVKGHTEATLYYEDNTGLSSNIAVVNNGPDELHFHGNIKRWSDPYNNTFEWVDGDIIIVKENEPTPVICPGDNGSFFSGKYGDHTFRMRVNTDYINGEENLKSCLVNNILYYVYFTTNHFIIQKYNAVDCTWYDVITDRHPSSLAATNNVNANLGVMNLTLWNIFSIGSDIFIERNDDNSIDNRMLFKFDTDTGNLYLVNSGQFATSWREGSFTYHDKANNKVYFLGGYSGQVGTKARAYDIPRFEFIDTDVDNFIQFSKNCCNVLDTGSGILVFGGCNKNANINPWFERDDTVKVFTYVLDKITNFKASYTSVPASITLSWDANTEATNYIIEKSINHSEWSTIATLNNNQVSYIDTDGINIESNVYSYRIKSVRLVQS